MASATPGPWIAQAGTTTGREIVSPSSPKTRRVIARCGGPDRDANARLIASAFEMVAALKHADAILSDGGDLRPDGPTHNRIRDALNKAEGRF